MIDESDKKKEDQPLEEGDEDPTSLWLAPPDITAPTTGTVLPGFRISGKTVNNPDEWELQILVGSTVIHKYNGQSGHFFDYDVPGMLITPGTGFYFKLDWYSSPFWSKWAWSGDKVMGIRKPDISLPVENSTIRPFELIRGKGYPGATVELYEANAGGVCYAIARVNNDGDWQTTPDVPFPSRAFRLITLQRLNSVSSDWSDVVGYTVTQPEPVTPPVITTPVEGGELYYKGFVKGAGISGASIALYQTYDPDTIYGRTQVIHDGTWSLPLDRELPIQSFEMTAKQTLRDVTSDWAKPVRFDVVSLSPPLIKSPVSGEHFRYDRHLSGEGIPDALLVLYMERGGEVYGMTVVDEHGQWSAPLNKKPAAGPFTITAVQVLGDGVISDYAADVPFTIIH